MLIFVVAMCVLIGVYHMLTAMDFLQLDLITSVWSTKDLQRPDLRMVSGIGEFITPSDKVYNAFTRLEPIVSVTQVQHEVTVVR